MTFGEKLTGLRKREGLSQEALAEQLGVSRQAVSRWEQGAALPDAAKLLPCARLFSVDVEWLLDEEQDGEDRLSAAEFLQGTERPSVHRDWPWYIAGGIVTGAGFFGYGDHGDSERRLSCRGFRGSGGGGVGPHLHRPGWFSESSRRRVALCPLGGGGPGGALAAGPAAYPATGADGLPVFLLVRRGRGGRAVRRRSDRLVCPAGQAERPASAGPFRRRRSGARCGSFGGWAGSRTRPAGGRNGSLPCYTPSHRESFSC